jgi:WhiB family redox-sensing transcriptional regulator
VFVANILSEGGSSPGGGSGYRFTPELGGLLAAAPATDAPLPCGSDNADLWFAERPDQLGRAQALCRECPIRRQCLAGALERREPWGVWGGEIFERGRVIPFKRGRGRPAKVRSLPESTVA